MAFREELCTPRDLQPLQGPWWKGGGMGHPLCLIEWFFSAWKTLSYICWRYKIPPLHRFPSTSFCLCPQSISPAVLCKVLLAPGSAGRLLTPTGWTHTRLELPGANRWPFGSLSLVPPPWEEQKALSLQTTTKNVPWKETTLLAREGPLPLAQPQVNFVNKGSSDGGLWTVSASAHSPRIA